MKPSVQRVVGDVVRIDLGDGFHSYARALEEALFAFYDCRVTEELAIDDIVRRPMLFQIPVMRYAIAKGSWTVVGHRDLEPSLRTPAPRFMQDALRRDQFRIYENGRARPAIREECTGLEREAVWDPEHVEDRLRDHYAGRKNKWVESLRIKE